MYKSSVLAEQQEVLIEKKNKKEISRMFISPVTLKLITQYNIKINIKENTKVKHTKKRPAV